jgi:hypothetical protein
MTWGDQDNKHYRGHIDRIYVSLTETWEVGYFIRHFLGVIGEPLTDANKAAVGKAMQQYPAHAPAVRDNLVAWLKAHFGR